MRILWGLLVLFITVLACNTKEKINFKEDQLIGTYKVDVSSAIDEFEVEGSEENKWVDAVKGIANAAISSLNLKVHFENNNKGIVEVNKNMVRLAQKLTDEPIESENLFWYKVEQDSIIFIKKETEDDFKKWGILKRISRNYDSIKMYVLNNDRKDEKLFINLARVDEK